MIITEFLSADKVDRYEDWLKQQDPDTRALYFGIPTTDYVIESLMKRIRLNPDDNYFLVATEHNQWVGTVHIAINGASVELGIIVAAEHRGQGIGSLLIEEAIVWARNRGYTDLFMHCLSRNAPIRHLCEKHGLATTNIYAESEVNLKLSPPNIVTFGKEIAIKQRNAYHMLLQNSKLFYQEIYG